ARRQTSFTLAEFRATVRAELLDGWEAWLGDLGRRAEQEYGGRAPDPGSWTAAHRLFFDRVQGWIRTTEQAYQARTFAPDVAAPRGGASPPGGGAAPAGGVAPPAGGVRGGRGPPGAAAPPPRRAAEGRRAGAAGGAAPGRPRRPPDAGFLGPAVGGPRFRPR